MHCAKTLVGLSIGTILVLLGGAGVRAQSQAAAGSASADCADMLAISAKLSRAEGVLADWPNLARYRLANANVEPPGKKEQRVVFLGDSITDVWVNPEFGGFFPGKPYVDRGISGQTTPQMLIRFRPDVIALQPKVVVILAGTNDIAGNTGPMTLEQTEDNLASMADLATANHIRVVLCSVLPAYDFPWHPGLEPAPNVVALNTWIKSYAAEKAYVYVDYHSAMKDQRDGLPPSLSKDGVHPTAAGYAVMAPLVEAGIKSALAQ